MAGAAPAGGGALAPPAALALPAVAHVLTRCNIPGADNTLDYVYAPSGAKLVSAFPKLGWIDANRSCMATHRRTAAAVVSIGLLLRQKVENSKDNGYLKWHRTNKNLSTS